MPLEIVRNDIANMRVDAIVNTANIRPEIGVGVDSSIHEKAGPRLLAARKKIGVIHVGSAAVTPAYDLNAKYVIHTVCPVWQGGNCEEASLLRMCYEESLELARRKWCKSVAFPLMSAGNHGFPKDLALEIATTAISAFLKRHDMQVYLVVFSRSAWQLSESRYRAVSSYIDECYVREKNLKQYGVADKCDIRQARQEECLRQQMELRAAEEEALFPGASCEDFFEPFPESDAPEEFEEAAMPDPCAIFLEEEEEPAPRPRKTVPKAPQRFAKRQVSYDGAPSRPASKRPVAPSFSLPTFHPVGLEDMLKKADAGFTETLFQMIDKTGKKDSEIYKKANIDRKHFSKIRKNRNYQPSKATAVAFAIALELDLEQTRDFIGRAGFALSHSSTFDIIIEYFILNRNYNIHEINMTLFEFDQSLLGA